MAIGGCHASEKNPLVRDGHLSLSRYRNDIEGSFIFTVARNPWDRLVSCYNYAMQRSAGSSDPKAYWLQRHDSFSDFVFYLEEIESEFGLGGEKAFKDDPDKLIRSLQRCHLRNVVDCVSLEGRVMADFICNFHNLEEDWRVLSGMLGFPRKLKRTNASPVARDYRSFYDDRTVEIVRRIYSMDIEYFGYSFDDPGCFVRREIWNKFDI